MHPIRLLYIEVVFLLLLVVGTLLSAILYTKRVLKFIRMMFIIRKYIRREIEFYEFVFLMASNNTVTFIKKEDETVTIANKQ